MVNNYEFCADFAASRADGPILDYGCGEGTIVSLLLDRGLDAYGCEVFYDGGSYRSSVPADLIEQGRIKEMPEGRIPFPDGYFDVVLHNQVFEHVPDLELAVAEIARVLRPGGTMLALFPDSTCWREGHCGVPFLHWFPKGSSVRVYYALAVRAMGGGYHHGNKSRLQWAKDFCQWLDEWTYYRPRGELGRVIGAHFSPFHNLEAEYIRARKPRLAWLPRAARTFAVRRGGGLVFWCEKRPQDTVPADRQRNSGTASAADVIGRTRRAARAGPNVGSHGMPGSMTPQASRPPAPASSP